MSLLKKIIATSTLVGLLTTTSFAKAGELAKQGQETTQQVKSEKGKEAKQERKKRFGLLSRISPFNFSMYDGNAKAVSDYKIVPIDIEGKGFSVDVDYLRFLLPYRIDIIASGSYGEIKGKEIHKLDEDIIYDTKTIEKELGFGTGVRILDNEKHLVEAYALASLQHGIHTSRDNDRIVSVNYRSWAIGPEIGIFGKHNLGKAYLEWDVNYFNLQGRQRSKAIIDLSEYGLENNIVRDRKHTRIYGAEAWLRSVVKLNNNFYLGGEASARYSQMKTLQGNYTHEKDYSIAAIIGGEILDWLDLEAVIGYTHSRGADNLQLNGFNAGVNLNFEY